MEYKSYKEYEGYSYVTGGVCAPKGFKASGMYCGIKKGNSVFASKNDIAMVVADCMCDVAVVYTTNKVKGAPITVTKKNMEASGAKAKAVIVNSKNANTCNADGEEKAFKMCELTADALGINPHEVIVASTGVIGQILPIEPIIEAVPKLVEMLSYDGNEEAAKAIMTTDTVKKEVAVQFELEGTTCTLGGMAKGSGMIHPNMATTLNFITTDVAIDAALMQKALSDVTKVTYNCLSIDGDTSTNDMVSVMANGMAGNEKIASEGPAYEAFKQALYIVMERMTMMLAADGEGATKLVEAEVAGAPDLDTAIIVAKSIIRSPLTKCAMFGEDANWGRILCAIGYAEAEFDIDKVDVDITSENGIVEVCRNGAGVEFSEDIAANVLAADEIYLKINLNQGDSVAKAWGCDLTYDYVKINGDYRS